MKANRVLAVRLLIAILLTFGPLGALNVSAAPLAASVTPQLISGSANPRCSDLQGPGQTWTELKVDPPANGTFTDGTLTVTETVSTGGGALAVDSDSDANGSGTFALAAAASPQMLVSLGALAPLYLVTGLMFGYLSRRITSFLVKAQTQELSEQEAAERSLRENRSTLFQQILSLTSSLNYQRVLDKTLDEELQMVIVRHLAQYFNEYTELHGVRSRRSGSNVYIEIFLEFDGERFVIDFIRGPEPAQASTRK